MIRITNVQKSNEGRFECTASNLAGQATVMAYLGVLIPPTIEMTPTSSIQVNFKGQLVSECPFPPWFFEISIRTEKNSVRTEKKSISLY